MHEGVKMMFMGCQLDTPDGGGGPAEGIFVCMHG
jgi:hypothetical protein